MQTDGWMFASCDHLRAAPQHVGIRDGADLISVSVRSAVQRCNSKLSTPSKHFNCFPILSTHPQLLLSASFCDLCERKHPFISLRLLMVFAPVGVNQQLRLMLPLLFQRAGCPATRNVK